MNGPMSTISKKIFLGAALALLISPFANAQGMGGMNMGGPSEPKPVAPKEDPPPPPAVSYAPVRDSAARIKAMAAAA